MRTQIDTINLKSGIYCAIHRDSLRCYVGSSVDMGRRRRTHILDAKKGSLNCFHKALRKFGEDAFDFEVLEYCDKYSLVEREAFWIKFLNSASIKGFNTDKNPNSNYDYGASYSDATRQRLREAATGRKVPQEVRDKISASMKGRKKAPEHVQKVQEALINRAIALGNRNENPTPKRDKSLPYKKVLTEQHKESLRKVNLGRKHSEETKKKISEFLTGRKMSPETIAKRVAKTRGQKRTPEQKARLREGILRGIAERKKLKEG